MLKGSRARLFDIGEKLDYTFAIFHPDTYVQRHIYNFEVAGVYVYIMMALYELSNREDTESLEHAEAAAVKIAQRGFDLTYELNGVVAGAVGCFKLYQATGKKRYLDQRR